MVLTASSHDPANAEIKALYADLSGTRLVRVHGERRRPHLCAPRHDDRHAAHRHRPDSGTARRRPCPGRSRRQSRGTARADRGKTSAAAAILFPSGPSRRPPRDPPPSRQQGRAHQPVLPFRPPRRLRRRRKKFVTNRAKPRRRAKFSDRLYEPYEVQTITITGAKPHPTKLVQSAAMASVRPPLPSYRPLLPKRLIEDRPSVGCADRDRHLCGRSAWRDARRPL